MTDTLSEPKLLDKTVVYTNMTIKKPLLLGVFLIFFNYIDCEIRTIVLAINADDDALVAIKQNWKMLALKLSIRQIDILKIEEDLRLDKKSTSDVVVAILQKWVSKKGDEATLRKLIDASKGLELEKVVSILEKIQYGNL